MTRRPALPPAGPSRTTRRPAAGGTAATPARRHGAAGAGAAGAGAAGAPAARQAYHHGALRQALIDASESLLAERGAEGFSLREVARRIGVSPAAPAHHFGDANGLLAAVARHAFDDLTAALEAGNARGGSDPVARLREQGVGYVGFALGNPGRFGLMFRTTLDKDEALQSSAHAAFVVLENGVRDLCGLAPGAALGPREWRVLVATWSIVHGFAHLALAGQFAHAGHADASEALLRETLAPTMQMQLRALVAEARPGGQGPPAPAPKAAPRSRTGPQPSP